ncbi:hypothetical protein LFL96_34320 [Paraburkholderia sp. D15]|uniref:hypothetical protein n=1 Tax=Paraburkholderia sp. D15 TaxID=2880218 RepID=UPI00247901F5|nr:hypothetical protein [Paraburkholderia sp. D15]WGS53241.1 hypothetical protein LFL96_34320 [Paraburkholderia sp. D15]WKF61312.1 hypothetical protein HUO10_005843 [Paraburkholderia busanensis]
MPAPLTNLLGALTRHGPSVLAGGVALGLLLPSLAEAARPLMPVTVFIFVLGTLLRVDPATVVKVARRPAVSLLLPVLAMIVVPVLIGYAGYALALPAGWTLALVLGFSAPPSSGTSAVARMLGLDAPVALVATLAAMVLAPLTAPLLAGWFSHLNRGAPVALGAGQLALRLALLIGSAEGVAIVVRKLAGQRLARHAGAIDVTVVIALLTFALGTMAGMQRLVLDEPRAALLAIGLAFAANLAVQTLAFLSWPGSVRERFNVALLMGNRNVGLLWAALGLAATPTMTLFFSCAQLPIYTLPRLVEFLLPRIEALSGKRRGRSSSGIQS